VVVGVPAVAVGITATQLGAPPLLEYLAAWLMAASGAVAAWLHLRLAWALAGMAAGGEGARLRSAGRTSCPVGPATTY